MTPETVRRFTIKWNGSEYKLSIPGYYGGEVVDAKSYDLLHAQAVALAERVMSIDHAILSCASNRDLLDGGAEDCNCIKQQAQALLEKT